MNYEEETWVQILKMVEKLEVINLQMAKRNIARLKTICYILFLLCGLIVITFIALVVMQSPYLEWDFNNPELEVAGTILHGYAFVFVRLAPILFVIFAIVIVIEITYKKK